MLWSKQFYQYIVKDWLEGDPNSARAAQAKIKRAEINEWKHLYNDDVISMPDKWEYPWYAAWDLAFHCIPLALVDSEFAKRQLILILREWYMHPNGQIPAYEWAFRRRQSAGSRVGGAARLSNRSETARRKPTAIFWKGFFTNCF